MKGPKLLEMTVPDLAGAYRPSSVLGTSSECVHPQDGNFLPENVIFLFLGACLSSTHMTPNPAAEFQQI